MDSVVMIIERKDRLRAAIRQAFMSRYVRTFEVTGSFDAMSALGRADFGAVVLSAGKRQLSLRGFCQLARRRHPGIHLFVILSEGTTQQDFEDAVGVGVTAVSAETNTEQLAMLVVESMAEAFVDPNVDPNKPEQPSAVPAPLDLPELDEAPEPVAAQQTGALLQGTLEKEGIAPLLMSVAAQELSGRLEVGDGDSKRILFFATGEPVWANAPDGDAGFFRRLVQKGVLASDFRPEAVPQGQLLASLMRSGILDKDGLKKFMLEFVREGLLELLGQQDVDYLFFEDETFAKTEPLLRLNPFGLILEYKRRSMTPDRLLAVAHEIEKNYLHPLPALGPAAERLSPFIQSVNINEFVTGYKTVEAFSKSTSLDVMMGALVTMALIDARLVRLSDNAPSDANVRLRQSTGVYERNQKDLVSKEGAASSPDELEIQRQIFSLYMQLKPLTVPRQVLGVHPEAAPVAIKVAYQSRMLELDPERVQGFAQQETLENHMLELRRKVEHAYEVLQMQSVPVDSGVNPF